MFIVTCDIQFKDQYKEELLTLSRALIAHAKKSHGCLSFQLLEDQEHPGNYVFLERWSKRRDLIAYIESDECQVFMQRLSEMMIANTIIELHSIELTEENGFEKASESVAESIVASP